ncbi:CAP domain-containing protein [Kocuria sp. M1R5S2]|uniref:CAP domain-containing protein n=1 Tax=Kocuria rhizosphaerae TaxID=3376285 RepID=UPI00378D0649
MNLIRTVLTVSTAAALLLGGLPAAHAMHPGESAGAEAPAADGHLHGGAASAPVPEEEPVPEVAPDEHTDPGAEDAVGGPVGAAAATHPTTVAHVAEAFRIVNDHRSQAKRAPLAYNTELSRNAQRWADAMAAAGKEMSNPDPWAGAPAGGIRMDQYYGRGQFTGAFAGADAVEALTHYLLDFYPRNGTDQFARDLTHLGIGVSHVATSGPAGPGWQTYVTLYYYAYPAGQTVPGTYAKPVEGAVPGSAVPAYGVRGAIGNKWAQLGGTTGVGAPIMAERGGLAEGGVYQEFRRADGRRSTIYWSPSHGANVIHNTASIGRKWIAAGREHNFGLPSTDERGISGGAYQVFTRQGRGTKVLWSPGAGSRAVKEYGAIGRAWKAAGHERGYGFPVTDEYPHGAEVRQRFSNGYTVHWSAGRTWVTR